MVVFAKSNTQRLIEIYTVEDYSFVTCKNCVSIFSIKHACITTQRRKFNDTILSVFKIIVVLYRGKFSCKPKDLSTLINMYKFCQ